MVYLDRPYDFNFLKAVFRQILLGPFLNIVSHIFVSYYVSYYFSWRLENVGFYKKSLHTNATISILK